MPWARTGYTKGDVDRAGRVLSRSQTPNNESHALEVLNNWRAAHSFPLNTFQMGLSDVVSSINTSLTCTL